MPIIKIDGESLAEEINRGNIASVKQLKDHGIEPRLATVMVGNDRSSWRYQAQILLLGQRLGVQVDKQRFPKNVKMEKVQKSLLELSQSSQYQGIILLFPLPPNLDPNSLIQVIGRKKDVDGFHPENIKALLCGRSVITPGFPQAMMLMAEKGIGSIKGKQVLINAKPGPFLTVMRHLCLQAGAILVDATAEIDMPSWSKYHLILSAKGEANSVPLVCCSSGVVVIDGSTNLISGRTEGDVDYSGVDFRHFSCSVSPVPRGVGPVTGAAGFRNFLLLASS